MKIGRFQKQEEIFYGIFERDSVCLIEGEPYSGDILPGKVSYPLADVRTLVPCVPSKAVCVGLNYRDHAAELGLEVPDEPVLFLKPSSAVIGPDEHIVCPEMSKQVDYEAEMAVVIGRTCRNISQAETASYILGYTCAIDVTARDLQRRDGQWSRAKSFDTFLPLGPCIVNGLDPGSLKISLYLNGALKQQSSTKNLIFNVPYLVSFISRVMTLNSGDVILTGTPAGVGPLHRGDRVEVIIEGIGRLANQVR